MSTPPPSSGYYVRVESPGIQIMVPVEIVPGLFEALRESLRICHKSSQTQGIYFPEEVLHLCGVYQPVINADMTKVN